MLLTACVATAPVSQNQIEGACKTADGRVGGEPGTHAAEIIAAKIEYEKNNAELRKAGYMLAGGDPLAVLRHVTIPQVCSSNALTYRP